jgi:hypothetical protein
LGYELSSICSQRCNSGESKEWKWIWVMAVVEETDPSSALLLLLWKIRN